MKKTVKKIFDKIGYSIHKKSNSHDNIGFGRGIFEPHYLSKIIQPKTVIDVGVAHGTYPLYRAFPDSYFILRRVLFFNHFSNSNGIRENLE